MKPFQNGTSDEPDEAERRQIEAIAHYRRRRLNCEHSEPTCSDAESEAILRAVKTVLVSVDDHSPVIHAELEGGERMHCRIWSEAIRKDRKPARGHNGSDYDDQVEAIVALQITSHYTLTAYGWDVTAGTDLAIIDEVEARRACPFCKAGSTSFEMETAEPFA